jgi:hypothetical protein
MKKINQLYAILFRWASAIPVVGRLFPRHPYLWPWSVYACFNICHTIIFRMGYWRSILTPGSVDGKGRPQPWFSYPAIEFLKRRNLSRMDVFEFGSGFGTAWFSANANSVTTVEHQSNWRDKVEAMCAGNTDISLATNKADYLAAIEKKDAYHIIVVDAEHRLECAKVSVNRLRRGGMIIVDNTESGGPGFDAAEYLESNDNLLRVDFWGFAPCCDWYGDTTIFFDRKTTNTPKGG